METTSDYRYPLQDFTVLESSDIDESRDVVAKIFRNDHSLELIGKSARLDARMHYIPVGGCSLSFFRYGGPLQIHVTEAHNFYHVQIPLTGPAQVSTQAGKTHSMPGMGVVISAGAIMHMDFAPNTNRLIVRFEEDRLERHLGSYLGREIEKRIEFRMPFPMDSPGGRAFQSLTIDLTQKIDRDVTLLQSPIVATHYEQLLMSILLQAQYHNYWDELQAEASPATPYYVKRVLTYLYEHADQEITMETLVEQSGVSARSLYAGFQRFHGTTPMAYLKSERLCRARAELLAADPAQVTVTEIATKWNFFHLGRFSGYCRKAFGEPPSVTLKRNAGKL